MEWKTISGHGFFSFLDQRLVSLLQTIFHCRCVFFVVETAEVEDKDVSLPQLLLRFSSLVVRRRRGLRNSSKIKLFGTCEVFSLPQCAVAPGPRYWPRLKTPRHILS